MKKHKNKPEKISDIVSDLSKSNAVKIGFELIPVWQQWEEIIGKDFSSVTKLSGFKRGVLYIKVKNTTIMHRLTFEKERILNSIREKLKKNLVQDLFFELDEQADEEINHPNS